MEIRKRTTGLSYAVRPAVVCKYLGEFSIVLAVLTAVPLAVSLPFGEVRFAVRSAAVAAALVLLGRKMARLPRPSSVQTNEALVIAALTFLVASTVLVYPMMGSGLSAADAFFENVSAVTTTGLTTTAELHLAPEPCRLRRPPASLPSKCLISLPRRNSCCSSRCSPAAQSDRLPEASRCFAR